MGSAFLDRQDLNLRLGFSYAYRQVLEDLRQKSLSQDCYERKLESALAQGIESLETNRVEILNESYFEELEDEENIKIVDIQMTIGAPIDRRECESLKLEMMNLPKLSNFFNMYTVYMPNNAKDDLLPLKCGIIV